MFEGEGCGDPCGWLAAAIAAITYGSYGVPVKATLDIDVHPLVFQSYKTVVLFSMSWIVLLLGEEAKWTGYGIFAGFLWVAGGTMGVLGIRNAGMAVAVGTWASVMVLINFFWGILIFKEPVNSFPRTCLAFGALITGLVGMSKYSAATKVPKGSAKEGDAPNIELALRPKSIPGNVGILSSRRRGDDDEDEAGALLQANESGDEDSAIDTEDEDKQKTLSIHLAGVTLTHREFGIVCAALNGILAGSSLIPMHFAKAHGFFGRSFILSFGSGSLAANISIWILYFVYKQHQEREGVMNLSLKATWDKMPAFHLKELWLRGLVAGLLLTVGMFSSILSISFLGQGVGNSLVQTKILISGIWGIFWFKEVQDRKAILKWFGSAGLCVSAILWLSYERNSATKSA